MTRAVRSYAVAAALLAATQPGYAGPCSQSITALQLQLDDVIEQRAGSGPSRPESIEALRNYQPTPRSLAQAVEAAGNGSSLLSALDALERAREADRSADVGRCNDELNKARQAIGCRGPDSPDATILQSKSRLISRPSGNARTIHVHEVARQ